MTAPHIRQPMEHELKTWPEFFARVWDGTKRFELRLDDRGFQGGDTLLLREWSKPNGYSGRALRVYVPYLLGGQWPGLQPDYVVMSIEIRERFPEWWPLTEDSAIMRVERS
jgi:hypothetical protein